MVISPFSLENKNILVTGASSGIGRATAVACSKMGATLLITGRNEDELQNTIRLMSGSGHRAIIADLNEESELDNLVNSLPLLDGFVSNAGINKRMLVQYLKTNEIDVVLNTNLISPILLTKKLLKLKRIKNGASLIYLSSIAVFQSSIGDSVYSATKGGLNSFSKVLALELAGKKIRVNTIQPGMVRTNLMENGPLSSDEYQKDEKKYPLGRYGNPDDIAYAAVYLLSDQTCWMTGTDLIVDGGRSLI
jgi:NAD(P)-dependent dehydrogenase (short-subunit alcohol dehydrogenase family)